MGWDMRMDKVPNARISELFGVAKGMDERTDGVPQWFAQVEKMKNDRIAESVCGKVYRKSLSRSAAEEVD